MDRQQPARLRDVRRIRRVGAPNGVIGLEGQHAARAVRAAVSEPGGGRENSVPTISRASPSDADLPLVVARAPAPPTAETRGPRVGYGATVAQTAFTL